MSSHPPPPPPPPPAPSPSSSSTAPSSLPSCSATSKQTGCERRPSTWLRLSTKTRRPRVLNAPVERC
eukprot:189916-Hanusia_phi.AAC.3